MTGRSRERGGREAVLGRRHTLIAGLGVAVLALGFVVATPISSSAVGPGEIAFDSSTASVTELDGAQTSVTLTVLRTVGTDGIATVDYGITGGTATAGVDFVGPSGTLIVG